MRKITALALLIFIPILIVAQSTTTEYIDVILPNSTGFVDIQTGLKINTSTVTVNDVLDEDTMASDSATALATQQSIKTYVDNQVAAITPVDLTTDVTGILPIANGGTALSSVPTNGQLLVGNGTNYTLATLTGTADQINVSNGAGSITLSTPQSIATTSTPTFAGIQSSDAIIFDQIATPSNPPANDNKLYFKSDDNLYILNSAGTEVQVGTAGVPNLTIATKSANYTLTASDDVILGDTTTAGFTLTLPTAVGNEGKKYHIKKNAGSPANVLQIDADGTETIDGDLNVELSYREDAITLISDNSNWQILNADYAVLARASTNGGGANSFTSGGEVRIDFEDIDDDPFGDVGTGSLWTYTTPLAGWYHIDACVSIQSDAAWAAGEFAYLALYVAGALNYYIAQEEIQGTDGSLAVILCGSALVSANKADSIYLTLFQNSGSTLSLATSGAENFINIRKVERF